MMRRVAIGWAVAVGLVAGLAAPAHAAGPGLDEARSMIKVGKYAEALEALDALAKADPPPAPAEREAIALARAEALESTGEVGQASQVLRAAMDAATAAKPVDPKAINPDLWARQAEIFLGLGEREAAAEAAKLAREANPDHLLARWVEARLLEARGDTEGADAAYKWFVDYQNAHEEELSKDAAGLLIVGQAAEKYFRANMKGEEQSEALNDVINQLYEAAIKADPECWRAPWLEGRLFLAGYQEGDARRELTRALRINPHAPEVLVTLGQADLQGYKLAAGRKKAERALEINPRYAPAHILIADLNISDERFADAKAAAEKAVAENPRDEDALARLAASSRLLVDPLGALAVEAVARSHNPRPATFYAALAERLADRRKYHSAEKAFLQAIEADPRRADTRIGLGMLYMQIGREPEARDLFEAAFESDPFNVRANNMRLILKHMAAYKPVDSPHYTVLYDPTQDKLLARYASRYLESIHGELTERFGFSLPGMTQIEIMKDHEKFSGRTVALPFIPTVGACTGTVVALASPKSSKKPYNWARVLKHELTHVITLQQTEFNIPHWYTEALAVESEGYPRPQPWNQMLQERVPARKVFNLDNINLGFIRPDVAEDRQMAYCQAQLYAQYMVKRFGADAQIRMLDAYRRGMTTDAAVKHCFNVEKADFEEKFLVYLDEVVASIRTRVAEEKAPSMSVLERKLKENPEDATVNAQLAYEHFARRDLKKARPLADAALKLQPNQPLAAYVKARLYTSIGDDDAALEVLRPALDPEKPNERVVDLLAELEMKAGKLDEAARLYELARKDDPQHTKWIANLARVHLRQGDQEKLLGDLEKLAVNDADDIAVRKTLAERRLAAGQPAQAETWATEMIYIDTYDPTGHILLADALAAQGKHAPAAEEYETALTLKPKKPDDLRVRLAKSRLALGDKDGARATLDDILARDPDHPEAKAARESIEK
ncbi:tetratricopeptide repeat protein [Tundrisphaera sp. TA3]|uniref:tetratricopeptide repeat protein n=1 Tax=Tundrisphaera sp. TA3 TaxID=3435775 RepID=UPI003EBF40A5